MPELAVTDSHALIWFATGRKRKLGTKARRFLESVDAGRRVLYVPTVAMVEIAEACHRGVVHMESGFSGWCAQLLSSRQFQVVDLTIDVLLKAEELYGIPGRGDRLIAATAARMELPLITRDPSLGEEASVDTIW